MIDRIKQLLTVAGLTALVLAPALLAQTVTHAACDDTDLSVSSGVECTKTKDQKGSLFGGDGSAFKTITNVLLFVIGAVSVIMLIIGGIRYTISQGDSSQVTAAKN